MSLLCWKFCPDRESCGYMCSCLGRACCLGSSGDSKLDLKDDPLTNAADNSRLHVRRSSRLSSMDSLDEPNSPDESEHPTDHRYLSPASAANPSSHKIPKKISLHKRALKTMMRKGTSTPNLPSSGETLHEEPEAQTKKHKRHFGKGSKEKHQLLEMHSIPTHGISTPSNMNTYHGDVGSPDFLAPPFGYGSLLQIPTSREESSDCAFSDEDSPEHLGTRSLGGGSGERLLTDFSPTASLGSAEWASLYDKERGRGDGSSLDVGSRDNPFQECYGSITITARIVTQKVVSIAIHSLQGLPCRKGEVGGLTLEISLTPGGKIIWLPLPQAQGSKVIVNSDVTVKLSHGHNKPQDSLIRISVWPSGRNFKYCAIGNVLTPVPRTDELLLTLGIYKHTQITEGYGILEVCMESESSSASHTTITIQILKAKFSKDLIYEKSINSLRSLYKHKRDAWCRISLWTRGKKIEKTSTPRIFLPVTYDPYFRSQSKFKISRSMLPFSAVVIKVLLDKGLGLGESLLGKLVLGPQMYLGVPDGDSPPGILSHWGKALTHSGPTTCWHILYQ